MGSEILKEGNRMPTKSKMVHAGTQLGAASWVSEN